MNEGPKDAGAIIEAGSWSALVVAENKRLVDAARKYSEKGKCESTERAYASSWKMFQEWRTKMQLPLDLPVSAETLTAYLIYMAEAGKKVATIERALSAISREHKKKGLESPRKDGRVQEYRKYVRKVLGTAQVQKDPILEDDMHRVVAALSSDLRGIRDKALLLVGWAGGLRRSELVALNVEDIAIVREGMKITIRRSKTDQEGAGARVSVPFNPTHSRCPIRALQAWLEASKTVSGPIFRSITRSGVIAQKPLSALSVALIVKRITKALGLDPSKFGGHSLRSGCATSSARRGKPERVIQRHLRHRSPVTTRRYIHPDDDWNDNAVAGLLV